MEVEEDTETQPSTSLDKSIAGEATCLLDVLEVSLTDTEKRSTSGTVNLRDAYTVYLIETKAKDKCDKVKLVNISSIWRRYSEFELLKDYLQVTYPWVVTPPIPEKKALFPWQATPTDKFHPEFIDRRKAGLENFLLHVALHKQLSFDQNFINFLQQDDAWAESLTTTGYLGKADAKLKSLSASFMLKKPDKKFEETKNYSNELHSNISNLLKMRSKLIDRAYGIHKLHANYSRVFGEWSSFEKPMSEGLVKVAHLMNVYASLTNCMDEEEQFSDQMKEYLFYAESLRQVCRKQEMLQYEVERAEANLSAKSSQRQNLVQGKKGILSRWFTGVDTEEVKEFKLQQLDAQIHEAENQCCQTTAATDEFVVKALVDINQFQEQKVKDLKETLILYAILQIKMCKKGLSIWTNMRDCFENM